MPDKIAQLKHIAVAAHPELPEAVEEAKQIAAFLEERGIDAHRGLLSDEKLVQQVKARKFDLFIALGGDGTLLRAGHMCGPADVPIMGINLGHFGFLMEIRRDQWQDALQRFLNGDYWLEKRMMLCAERIIAGKSMGNWDVLNEAVVGRGQTVRPVHLETSVDGRFLTTYVADALIASTPTGSTAYALAAGGPILPPELRNILLVPVAPHLSIDRAIVLAEGSSVTITVYTNHQATFCVDGQAPISLKDGDRVHIKASDHSIKFVRFQDPGYFYRNLTPHMNQNPSTATRHR